MNSVGPVAGSKLTAQLAYCLAQHASEWFYTPLFLLSRSTVLDLQLMWSVAPFLLLF